MLPSVTQSARSCRSERGAPVLVQANWARVRAHHRPRYEPLPLAESAAGKLLQGARLAGRLLLQGKGSRERRERVRGEGRGVRTRGRRSKGSGECVSRRKG